MELHELASLLARRVDTGKTYLEFIRSADLSVGLYVLPAGGVDLQQPHAEDEVYYVIQGRGRFMAGSRQVEVQPGSTLFVPAGEPHRFVDITEELVLLVFFGPAEGRGLTRPQREPGIA
jgi:mannose-6-phosphate isomerase-like protein (cupin superfamily)